MTHYKFYFLQDDGHIFRAEDHEFPDDLSALRAAEERSDDNEIEVWQMGRMVVRVKKGNEALYAGDPTSL